MPGSDHAHVLGHAEEITTRNNMADSVKTDREREEPAEGGKRKHKTNLKQLCTELLGTSLLMRGGCDWPSIKTDFIFPHHTHSKRDVYYPVTELFGDWRKAGGCF